MTVRVIIKDNKLLMITERKTIHFELTKDVGNNLNREIDYIIKDNDYLAEHTKERDQSIIVKILAWKRYS